MRLVTAFTRASAAVARAESRGAGRPAAQGICWGPPPELVDRAALQPGESVATDVDVEEVIGGHYAPDTGAWVKPTLVLAQRERITSDPDDRGRVFQGGEPIGRVEEVVGKVITIAYASGRCPLDPPHCGHCGDEAGSDPDKHVCRQNKAV